MKKVFLSFAVLLMGCVKLTAYAQNNDNNVVSNGAFIVCSGNQYNSINSGLTYLDYAKGTATSDIFSAVNGKAMGVTANDGLVYGSKAYVVVDGENLIEVFNANTCKEIKQISTTALLGEKEGVMPRHIVAKDGFIFVSTFGGYVAVIDTVNYELTAKLEAGSYPEGMAFSGKMLFVANSDYGMGINPSISIFSTDLANKTFRKIIDLKDPLINNPISLVANGYNLYILCSDVYVYNAETGNYDFASAGGLRKYSMEAQAIIELNNAGIITSSGNNIYMIISPYFQPKYQILDMATDMTEDFNITEGVDIPNCMGVDPITGDVIVAGYKNNPETGYGDYSAPGKAIRYNKTGNYLNSLETAVGPTAIFFNTSVKDVTGITSLDLNPSSFSNNKVFDLQGRSINGVPSRGIYIKNGRKYSVK